MPPQIILVKNWFEELKARVFRWAGFAFERTDVGRLPRLNDGFSGIGQIR